MKYVFKGVEIEYISQEDLKIYANFGKFDYLGRDSDNQGEVWDIVRNSETGKYYCTNLTNVK